MAQYLIEDTTLTAIGNAIREKEGSADSIPVSDMAARIGAIEAGSSASSITVGCSESDKASIIDGVITIEPPDDIDISTISSVENYAIRITSADSTNGEYRECEVVKVVGSKLGDGRCIHTHWTGTNSPHSTNASYELIYRTFVSVRLDESTKVFSINATDHLKDYVDPSIYVAITYSLT